MRDALNIRHNVRVVFVIVVDSFSIFRCRTFTFIHAEFSAYFYLQHFCWYFFSAFFSFHSQTLLFPSFVRLLFFLDSLCSREQAIIIFLKSSIRLFREFITCSVFAPKITLYMLSECIKNRNEKVKFFLFFFDSHFRRFGFRLSSTEFSHKITTD